MDPKSVFSFDYVTKEELEKEIRLVNESKAVQEKKIKTNKDLLSVIIDSGIFPYSF